MKNILLPLFLILFLLCSAVVALYIYLKKNDQKKELQNHFPIKEQYTLEEIAQGLVSLKEVNSFENNIRLLVTIFPHFLQFLRVKPFTDKEANDLFAIWLLLSYQCSNILPINTTEDIIKLYKEYRVELSQIGDFLRTIGQITWLQEMMVSLMDVITCLEKYYTHKNRESVPSLERIINLLTKAGFIIETITGTEYLYTSKFSEFGLDLREVTRQFFSRKSFFVFRSGASTHQQ